MPEHVWSGVEDDPLSKRGQILCVYSTWLSSGITWCVCVYVCVCRRWGSLNSIANTSIEDSVSIPILKSGKWHFRNIKYLVQEWTPEYKYRITWFHISHPPSPKPWWAPWLMMEVHEHVFPDRCSLPLRGPLLGEVSPWPINKYVLHEANYNN